MATTLSPSNGTNSPSEYCVYCGTSLWMAVNFFTIFAAIMGNTLTISAILLSKKLSSIISNHFVFSLAVSDLLVGFSVPYHMCFYIYRNFGNNETNCLLRFVMTSFACASSICNLLFIAVDRYIAIVYPLHYNRYMVKRTAALLIIIGWLTSFSMSSVPLVWNEWHKGVTCEVINVLPNNYLKFVLCPMFVLIWIMMLLLYARICREASGHAKRIRSTTNLQTTLTIKDSKSFQVMLLILGCFTICWLPYFVITLHARTTKNKFPTLYEIFFNLAVANSCMNPLIYAWKNKNFRQSFLCIVKCHKPNSLSSAHFITNHVPSKRNSLNGICNLTCQQEDTVQNELGVELNTLKRDCKIDQRGTDIHVVSEIR